MSVLAQSFRDLRHDGGRLLMTILGVVWGTLAVTVLVAFFEGISHATLIAELGIGRNVVVVHGGSTSKPFRGLPAARRIRLTVADIEAVGVGVPAIEHLSREYGGGTALKADGHSRNVSLSAVDPGYQFARSCHPAPGGRFISARDNAMRRRVAVLGAQLNRRVFGASPAIGRELQLWGRPFKVIGVLRDKDQWSNYQNEDGLRVFIPASTYEAMRAPRFVTNFVYRVPRRDMAAEVEAQVYRVLSARHGFDPADGPALSVWDTTRGQAITEGIHLGVRGVMGLIGLVTLIVAGVGVANVMYVHVQGRTREIGIKMAVGAKPGTILRYHLLEGLIVVVVGGGIGLLLSWLLMLGIRALPLDQEALRYFGRPQMSVPTLTVVAGLLGLIGLLAGYFPARHAALTDPIDALRYE